jgi:hypothetical protein
MFSFFWCAWLTNLRPSSSGLSYTTFSLSWSQHQQQLARVLSLTDTVTYTCNVTNTGPVPGICLRASVCISCLCLLFFFFVRALSLSKLTSFCECRRRGGDGAHVRRPVVADHPGGRCGSSDSFSLRLPARVALARREQAVRCFVLLSFV